MTQDIAKNDAFCPMAWNGLYIEPTGVVDNCCVSKNRLGNINDQNLGDILSGPRAREVRKSMLKGVKVPGCQICYSPRVKMVTPRDTHISVLINEYRNEHLYKDADSFAIEYLDIRFRNTCNFACVYCGPELSSLWATEMKVFPIVENNSLKKSVDYVCKNLSSVQRVYLAGAEPLMIKENEFVLEKLIQINPDCQILVNTNLSLIENNKVFDLLLRFKNTKWLISAEDIEARYEYIRYPGKWKTFVDNLLKLKSLIGVDNIKFNCVYFAYNAVTIFDFFDFLKHEGFLTENIHVTWIAGKSDLDPRLLPKTCVDKIVEIIPNYYDDSAIWFSDNLKHIREKLITESKENKDLVLSTLSAFDQRRKLNSQTAFTDLYQYLI
jgi:MoaA/NifB/PqqE/SkfB family radical SAM enzyme